MDVVTPGWVPGWGWVEEAASWDGMFRNHRLSGARRAASKRRMWLSPSGLRRGQMGGEGVAWNGDRGGSDKPREEEI